LGRGKTRISPPSGEGARLGLVHPPSGGGARLGLVHSVEEG